MRILEYEYHIIKSAIDKENLGKKDYKFPRVISIVLYSGRKKWNVENNIEKVQEEIDGYSMQEFAKYNLVDVNNFSVEELLKEESFISKAMLIEKTRYSEDLSEYLEKIVKEINNRKDVYTKEQKEFFLTIMNLVLKKKIDEEKIKKLTNKLKEGDGQMLAVLETLEEENRRLLKRGEKRGRKIGIEEGQLKIAKNMLKLGFDVEIICKATELSKKEVEKIKQ